MARAFPALLSALAALALGGPVPANDGEGALEPCKIEKRKFDIPILVRADVAEELRELRFYVSADRGKSWSKVTTVKPKGQSISFTAPRDGVYWFSLLLVSKDGKTTPARVNELRPMLAVEVALNKAYGEWELRLGGKKGEKVTHTLTLTLDQSDRGELVVEHASKDGAVILSHSFEFQLSGEGDRRTIRAEGGPFKKAVVLPHALDGNRLWIKGGAATVLGGEVSLRGKWVRVTRK